MYHKTLTFVLLLFTCCVTHCQNFDIDLLRQINTNRNRDLDLTFGFISNSVTPISIVAPAGFLTYAIIKKDSLSRANATLMLGSFVVASIVSTSLKHIVNRERPFEKYSFIEKVGTGGSPSFPSGHTSSAFSLATALSIAKPKWYVIVPSYLWASSVGYSRMHLGVHYPSDVLAGAIVGSGSALLSHKLNQWLQRKRSKK